MDFKQTKLLTVSLEFEPGQRQKVGRLAAEESKIFFEYDKDFLLSGLEISPFKLPLKSGLFTGDINIFRGLMGVFEDSLPDGWGRLLLDRRMAKFGFSPSTLGPLDRLAWVGSSSMGALVYEPEQSKEALSVIELKEVAKEVTTVLNNSTKADFDRLIALGGSPQGARPKILVQISKDGKQILHGASTILPGFFPYMIKFRSKEDSPDSATLEFAYSQMAKASGIEVPESKVIGDYFAVKRFDRDGRNKVHMHTLSGLLHAPHNYPSLTYRDLLLATRQLTRDESAVREIFRRACFNVFAHNRDDHAKNFAFLMNAKGQWCISPAYDLTYSEGMGGEHMLLIASEGKNPKAKDLQELAKEVGIKRVNPIIDEVTSAVKQFKTFAQDAGVSKKTYDQVWKILAF